MKPVWFIYSVLIKPDWAKYFFKPVCVLVPDSV